MGGEQGRSRNLGRGGHRKGVGVGGGCAPSRAKRGSFEQYSNTDTAKKRVESILDFQLIYHLHSGTYC